MIADAVLLDADGATECNRETRKKVNRRCRYVFQRTPKEADIVAAYYMIGDVHRPRTMCVEEFVAALKYWNIKTEAVSACCR